MGYSRGFCFFFSSRRRHTRYWRDWSSDVCSSDLVRVAGAARAGRRPRLGVRQRGGRDRDGRADGGAGDAAGRGVGRVSAAGRLPARAPAHLPRRAAAGAADDGGRRPAAAAGAADPHRARRGAGPVTTVVLVAGAWHGAWCWARVLPVLERAGHSVLPVPLTGVGEREHQLSLEVTLATHVEDVVAAVRAAECSGAVLVGHSYGGLVVTGAADRLGEEVGRLVYVDAVVPTPGQSWADGNPPETRAARRAVIAERGHIPPPPASAYGLTGDDAAWVERRQTPQPGGVYEDPLHFDRSEEHTSELQSRQYFVC